MDRDVQESSMTDKAKKHEQLYELLKEFDNAMLITHPPLGAIHARPMAVAELRPDADAYFVTAIDSPKVAEIEANPDVTLTFQSDNQFAAVYGRATVVRDRALLDRLWKEPWKVWFPQGKDDPSVALLKFDAERGEYWDNSGAEGLKYVFSAAKAYVSGETPKTDEKQHGRVRLQ
jgi:general stress protein 26